MRWVHEGEKITDGDRLDAGRFEFSRRNPHGFAIKPHEHMAGVIGSFRYFPGKALRRDRLRLGIEIVEQVAVTCLVLHFLDGAKSLGDQKPHLGAAHFQERVGRDGGAMRKELDCAGRDAARDEPRNPVEDAERGIFRRA